MSCFKRFASALFIIFMLTLFSSSVWAEETEEGIKVEKPREIRVYVEDKTNNSGSFTFRSTGYWGFSLIGMEFGYLNSLLQSEGFHMLDGQIFVTQRQYVVGSREGLRLGWSSLAGDQTKANDGKTVTYSLNMSGVLVEWGTAPTNRLDLGFGAVFGRGKHNLHLVFHDRDHLGDVIKEPLTTSIYQPFFFVEPQMNIRIRLLAWASLNLYGGYNFSIGEYQWFTEGMSLDADERHCSDGWRLGFSIGFGF